MRAVVVGIGQPMAGDDGVGPAVARLLAAEGYDARASTDASSLLPLLEAGRRVVLVDAVVGGGLVGTVLRCDVDAFEGGPAPLSSHGIGVVAALSLARTLYGEGATREVALIGVVIERPRGPGEAMSPAVTAAIPVAAAMARAIVEGG